MPKPNDFDIPRLFYFESGNHFTGSRGNMDYRIDPDGEVMHLKAWHGLLCSELAEIEDTADVPLTQEGFDQMLAWLTAFWEKGQQKA